MNISAQQIISLGVLFVCFYSILLFIILIFTSISKTQKLVLAMMDNKSHKSSHLLS